MVLLILCDTIGSLYSKADIEIQRKSRDMARPALGIRCRRKHHTASRAGFSCPFCPYRCTIFGNPQCVNHVGVLPPPTPTHPNPRPPHGRDKGRAGIGRCTGACNRDELYVGIVPRFHRIVFGCSQRYGLHMAAVAQRMFQLLTPLPVILTAATSREAT